MIVIDGSNGEVGGQVLRSALSLSACTGQPFRVKNIRAGRKKPGLMRQHLTCVRAAAEVCGGKAVGAALGSTELTFTPGEPKAGDYTFDIGTAGATTLVFQTVLPILLMAEDPSVVTFRGGTHTMSAPTLDFIERTFLPPLEAIGAKVALHPHSLGFYPAGGGAWTTRILPLREAEPLDLRERGPLRSVKVAALRSNLPHDICVRELETLRALLGLSDEDCRFGVHNGPGPGNAVLIDVQSKCHMEVFSAIGRHGVTAENVAKQAAKEAKDYLAAHGAVSEYLADQLLLPLALFAGGRFSMSEPSSHFQTNVETIAAFLDVDIDLTREGERMDVAVGRD